MGTHEPRTQEIQAVRVREEQEMLLHMKPSAADTPIYDELMDYYVRFFGWDESRPFGVVWAGLSHPAISAEGELQSGPDESIHSSTDSDDGANRGDTREFAIVSTDGVTLADADAIAESLMHDLPAASISPPVPPPASSKDKPGTTRKSTARRTRMASPSSEGGK